MKPYILNILLLLAMLSCSSSSTSQSNVDKTTEEKPQIAPGTRDPLKWPFAQNSIWNMPIGSKAVYVHTGIQQAMTRGLTVDEDYIVMESDAPLVNIYLNRAGWDRTKNRCNIEGDLLFAAPVPRRFVVSPATWDGLTPNAGLAVLMPDKHTIKQTQPFAFCDSTKGATSRYVFDDVDIYGDGMYGAHGGSGLSALGGTLRLGELTPASGPIRHALKINVFAKKSLYYDSETKGYRWPAKRSDSYAADNYGMERTAATVQACRIGALLSLPRNMNLDSLGFETEPGKILAKAFQDYGAYIVDDTAWDVYAICVEWSPDGRFTKEFKKNWGLDMAEKNKKHPWSRDIDRIFLNLHVVDNNSSSSIGGGGVPSMPLAPDFR